MSETHVVAAMALAAAMFLSMLLLSELGRRVGQRRFARDPEGALLAGYAMAGGRQRSWTHAIGFAAVFALTVYVILDLEYPRRGLIRVDDMDQVLIDLRESMR